MPIEYTIKKFKDKDMILIEFNIPGGVLDIKELEDVVNSAPEVEGDKGICISGRGPIWLYGALLHKYHYAKWLATYEPRKNACVVVASHDKSKRIGDLIPLEE